MARGAGRYRNSNARHADDVANAADAANGSEEPTVASSASAWVNVHRPDRQNEFPVGGDWESGGGVYEKNSGMFIELANSNLSDADLPSLFRYAEKLMKRRGFVKGFARDDYFFDMDLSSNPWVTDDGVILHVQPFLEHWPMCRRLKLYKTSIGDRSIEALSSWVAAGHARELHLSDLRSQVAPHVIRNLLVKIQKKNRYPYTGGGGVKCPLWLRLEHNGIRDTEKLVKAFSGLGISFEVVAKKDLGWVRPGRSCSAWYGGGVPAIQLVMFHEQEVRQSRKRVDCNIDEATVTDKTVVADLAASDLALLDDAIVGISTSHRKQSDSSSGTDAAEPAVNILDKWFSPQNLAPGRRDSQTSVTTAAFSNADEQRALALSIAWEIISVCPTNGDPEVFGKWCEHIEQAVDPEWEARRILRLTTTLSAQGFYGGALPHQSITTTPMQSTVSVPPVVSEGSPMNEIGDEPVYGAVESQVQLQAQQQDRPVETRTDLADFADPCVIADCATDEREHLEEILRNLTNNDVDAATSTMSHETRVAQPHFSFDEGLNETDHAAPQATGSSFVAPRPDVSVQSNKKGKNKISAAAC